MLITTVGLTVSKHYCADDVFTYLFVDETCNMGNMQDNNLHQQCDMDKNCCHSELETVQLLLHYIQENKTKIEQAFSFILPTYILPSQLNKELNTTNYQVLKSAFIPLILKTPQQSELEVFRC